MTKMLGLAALASMMLVSAPVFAAPDGKNRKVLIENVSSQSIREVYASPVTSTTWEEDLLGTRTLVAGTSISANIDNGTDQCYYDLKAVMADGREHVARKVNVCAVSKWTIGDSGNSVT